MYYSIAICLTECYISQNRNAVLSMGNLNNCNCCQKSLSYGKAIYFLEGRDVVLCEDCWRTKLSAAIANRPRLMRLRREHDERMKQIRELERQLEDNYDYTLRQRINDLYKYDLACGKEASSIDDSVYLQSAKRFESYSDLLSYYSNLQKTRVAREHAERERRSQELKNKVLNKANSSLIATDSALKLLPEIEVDLIEFKNIVSPVMKIGVYETSVYYSNYHTEDCDYEEETFGTGGLQNTKDSALSCLQRVDSLLKGLSQCKQRLLKSREQIEQIKKSADSVSSIYLETLLNQLSDIDTERAKTMTVHNDAQSIVSVIHSYFQRVLSIPNCLRSFSDSGGFILNLGQKIKWESAKSAVKTKNERLVDAAKRANVELSTYFKSKNRSQYSGNGLYWQEICGIRSFY